MEPIESQKQLRKKNRLLLGLLLALIALLYALSFVKFGMVVTPKG